MLDIGRSQRESLQKLLRRFPAVEILGPRQCGKSTLARMVAPRWHHVDLERPSDLSLLSADLEGFLAAHTRHVVLDEAQRLPELFPALRHAIDAGKGMGRYLILGSAGTALTRSVSETLAGRVGLLELAPFSAFELVAAGKAKDRWFWGGYPPVHARRGNDARAQWLDSYVSTFLERDLPALGVRLSPVRLRQLWSMITHVHGQLLNVSDLARSLGVSSHTVNEHLDVLEGAFMIRRLPPFFANVQKRLTKSPKIYVRDTGLLHFLAGLRQPGELSTWARRGHSFEGLVIEELITWARETAVRPEFFFWRTQAGAEVDLLIACGQRLIPVEIKLGSSIDQRGLAGLRQAMADLGAAKGFVVSTSPERRKLGRDIEIVPWDDIVSRQADLGFA